MAKEKRRLTVGNDDWQDISKVASKINIFGGTCDKDEPLFTIVIIQNENTPIQFYCLPGDILVEYDDGTWDIIEKPTNQSRIMSAISARLS